MRDDRAKENQNVQNDSLHSAEDDIAWLRKTGTAISEMSRYRERTTLTSLAEATNRLN